MNEQTAGQVIVAGFDGLRAPPEVLQAARDGLLGGAILFKRNVESTKQVKQLLAELGDAFPSTHPPLLAVDQEGGRVARLGAPVVRLPPARTFGVIDDPELTATAGERLGAQLADLGFNCDFAPVLDVDTNPDNPVIGDRSYGTCVDEVIRHGLAFATGLRRGGVLPCAKHFPGHGDTELDSHLALPKLGHDRARLDRIELAPFRAAGKIPLWMTAHVVFESLDSGGPATLSPRVITDLVRGELGYEGVVVSDDLEMKAVSQRWGVAEAGRLAIVAGCDALLVCSDLSLVNETRALLARSATENATFRQRLEAAARRFLELRKAPRPGSKLDPWDGEATAAVEADIGARAQG